MKTHQVIAGSSGERIVTSTTETLRIPASEIRPGDWLLTAHGRGMRKDRLVRSIEVTACVAIIFVEAKEKPVCMPAWSSVDVERTT